MKKVISFAGSKSLDPVDGGVLHQLDGLGTHVVDFLFILHDEKMPGLGIVPAGSPERGFEHCFKLVSGYLFRKIASNASSVFYCFDYGIHSHFTSCRVDFTRDLDSSYVTIAEKQRNCYSVHKFFYPVRRMEYPAGRSILMRNRTLSCIVLVLAFLFQSPIVKVASASPFSSSPEFRFMQRCRSKRDQRDRLKTIETYFRRKNPGVSPQNVQRYARLIDEYSATYDLDPFLVASVLVKESTVKEKAVSKGNYGLMQINWKANRAWIVKQLPIRSTKDLLVPENNIRLGATILSANIRKSGGDVDKGLDRYRGRPLASYRNSVLGHYTAMARIFRQLQPASL